MEFKELELLPELQENLSNSGFINLTKIQELAIPFALTGRDLTGLAQTGTGKTLAFLVPAVQKLLTDRPTSGKPFILALAPTRELVIQIAEEGTKLLKGTGYSVATIIGGTDYKGQEESLSNNPGLIVATPGRLIDFVKSRNLDITQVKIVIIDEADRMFDMGFVMDLKYVFHKCKDRSQTMLFSATLSFEVIQLAYKYLNEPVEVQVDADKLISERIEQKLYHLGREERLPYLVNLILQDNMEGLGFIFTNYKSNIPLIIRTLHKYGISTAGLSSDFDQKKRIRLLKDFKLGKYKIMVATDVASRGIDVANIDVVYNFDLPMDSENYVHRIGRTARAGRKGRSISFCSENDYPELERIEKYLKVNIPVQAVEDNLLTFPEGDFEAFVPDDPAIMKSLNDASADPVYKKSGRDSGGKSFRDNRSRDGKPSRDGRNQGMDSRTPREPRDARAPREPRESNKTVDSKGKKSFSDRNHNQASKTNSDYAKNGNSKNNKNRNDNKFHQKSNSNSKVDKSRRNLFDIEEVRSKDKEAKKSIWAKVKSLFGR
ncbi:DEAD/DEAH box helicase [Leptospira sp. GIMC2001]|uniref:DEAD/DEAH box helicase n=1 Tax=Leptospira sp. GIMC2001 TaxID=1513297 RepID=UPI00234A8BD0|nr:DEAD/DEAH box helicase [Leptospira sp. GIMC2001]WCL48213.1 DEAD/DEAH box helicase [Leptospira sp. GIMC2001]